MLTARPAPNVVGTFSRDDYPTRFPRPLRLVLDGSSYSSGAAGVSSYSSRAFTQIMERKQRKDDVSDASVHTHTQTHSKMHVEKCKNKIT